MDRVRSKDGTLIAYERSGTGPALVLVHGTTADQKRWASVLPMLEQQLTVYAVDRRGRGQSGDSAVYSIEREYEDIAAVVDSIQGAVNCWDTLTEHCVPWKQLCALRTSQTHSGWNRVKRPE
jgi:pimeloyl-ACP methyl ester carboxylesterase